MAQSPQQSAWTGVERRRAKRKLLAQIVKISLPGRSTPQPCRLRDLSALGAGIGVEPFAVLPAVFALSFDDFRTAFRCRVVWRDGERGGVAFAS